MANYIKDTAIQENSISETKLDSSLQSWKETVTNHINNNDNPHNITKSSIGLDNVTNDAQVKRSELGVANGVATLDSTGKVPSGQLPSYVDDVIEGYLYNGVFYKDTSYTTSIVGESGKIYIDLPTNKTYRWTGSVYGVISETIALGEISSTAYRGDRGKIAYDHSQSAHAPSNAQANVIETIKVNGTALTPNSKAVDITIPTVGNGTITIKQGGTSKGTFTTNQNGNTTIELTDTNTTYTAGDGLSLSGTTFSNNGVRSIATGTTNGTISVNTNGNISNIGVYGLKSAAYTNSSDYAAASHTHSQYLTGITKAMVEGVLTGNITSHTHSYLPLSGGTMANTNLVTNLNANLLEGYRASSFSKTQLIDLPVGQVLRISVEDRRGFLISMQGPNRDRNALYFVTGYGVGTTIRNDIRVIKGGPYDLYFNGESENACVYIVGTSSNATATDYIYINPFDYNDITYTIVSSVPSDAVLVSSSNSNILASLDSNVASASKWATPRTITLTGSVTGSVSIDGSQNVSLATTTNHTHTFDSLTSKPTTISGYGITDAYTASTIDSKLSGYLPLSGGTLTGTRDYSLVIKSGTTEYSAISFMTSAGDSIFFGYKYLASDTIPKMFFTDKNGWSKEYILLHSGNYNSYTPKLDGTGATGTWGISISGNAASATNVNGGYCSLDNLVTDFNAVKYAENKIRPIYSITDISLGAPHSYVSGLSVVTKYTGWQLVAYGGEEIPNPYFRSINDNGTWKPWRKLAFLDDNVASATQLQNSRTIWGQSFDGTGNVSGAITEVTDITASGNATIAGTVLIGTTNDSRCKLGVAGGRVLVFDSNRKSLNSTCIADSALLHLSSFASKNDGLFFGQMSDSTSWIQSAYYGTSAQPSSNHTYNLSLNPLGGNVGIGTTSPEHKLTVLTSSTTSYEVASFTNTAAHGGILIASSSGFNPFISFAYGTTRIAEVGYSYNQNNIYLGHNNTDIGIVNINTSSNNVGIGTKSPAYKLDVVGDGYFTENVITESDFSSRGNAIIDGRVGIGTSSPAYNLDVDGNMRITGPIRLNVPNSNENYYISTEYNGLLGITYEGRYQNPAFLMNNLGYVYLNCENPVSPAYPLVVNGTISCTTLLQTSDIKYKTNIKQIEYEEALKIIENLNPVTWDWNEDTKISGSSSGFIAQEVKDIIPNAVSEDNENSLSLDYTQLHSYEIKVIQEQQKEIKDLKQRLEVLESLVLQLTNKEI